MAPWPLNLLSFLNGSSSATSASPPEPLNIIIVGAGIAGLSCALTLSHALPTALITIHERSPAPTELGAAMHIPPSASRGLLALGFSPAKAGLVPCERSYRARGRDLSVFYESDERYVEAALGSVWGFAHRGDLWRELRRLVGGADDEVGERDEEGVGGGEREGNRGGRVVVKLGSRVVSYDAEAGLITLESGDVVQGDLIIAADGVHSKAVEAVLGYPNPALPTTAYNYAYRFLISAEDLKSDEETKWFVEGENGGGVMKFWVEEGKRLVSYPCRNGEEHNFLAFFHCKNTGGDHEDWTTSVDKSALLERYSNFHPSLLAVLNKAKDIKQWPLLYRAPIPTWHKGKLLLVGDAAHPMLPHQGQGGAQAIEDSVALGLVFTQPLSHSSAPSMNPFNSHSTTSFPTTKTTAPATKSTTTSKATTTSTKTTTTSSPTNKPTTLAESISERLNLYEDIRLKRATVMQIFSNAAQDDFITMKKEACKHVPVGEVPQNAEEFMTYNFGYDIVQHSKNVMDKAFPGWVVPEGFFVGKVGRGIYP